MRVVSTVHKAGFDQYGQEWLDGVKFWPAGTEFILYTEGFDVQADGVDCRRIESLERAETFKRRYKHYKPIEWRWDVVRFSNKMFAAYDALYDYRGIGVWLDADAITYNQLSDEYIANMLPNDAYMALFKRIGWATETGFWLMNCGHHEHASFLDTWIKWLETDSFKTLQQWCDNSMLDATVRLFERDKRIKTVSLSDKWETHDHPMSKVELARYIDHLKGEDRKKAKHSQENIHRAATIRTP